MGTQLQVQNKGDHEMGDIPLNQLLPVEVQALPEDLNQIDAHKEKLVAPTHQLQVGLARVMDTEGGSSP